MIPDEPEMERELARWRSELSPADFDAGFADRVMARLSAQRRGIDRLPRTFARLAPLAAAAALLLAVLNFRASSTASLSVVDRLLALPPVTLDAAYAFDNDIASWSGVTQ